MPEFIYQVHSVGALDTRQGLNIQFLVKFAANYCQLLLKARSGGACSLAILCKKNSKLRIKLVLYGKGSVLKNSTERDRKHSSVHAFSFCA